MSRSREIPKSVIKRLTKYLTHVEGLAANGRDWVSSSELARSLGLTSSTVRQDLTYVDFSGTSKKGYRVRGLQQVLTSALGTDKERRMVIVGAGNLGRALALSEDFQGRGFTICDLFDSDPVKIGQGVGPFVVKSIIYIPGFVRRNRVEIGVIAVPSLAAQGVADLLIASGIRGILNLAPCHIVVPESVAMVDERILTSLMELSHAVKCMET
jgi:redox-sensing transcriptional repressor